MRLCGVALEVPPHNQLPRWMIAANYQRPCEQPQGTTTSVTSGPNGTATPLVNVHYTPRDNFMDSGTYGLMYRIVV